MCKKVVIVTIACECKRCKNARRLDPNHEKHYPHYGCNVVNDDCYAMQGVSYSTVKKEDACTSAVLDERGYYKTCDNVPGVIVFEDKYATANGNEKGKRFCEDCLKVCLALRKDEDIPQGLDELEVSD
ncbi:hypothetical protein FHL15_010664 [Xylaria flabelliformis]|uniref:Uncharacterized protein n=1 Tax=Xylaria flabelliformis TaxID=2512241 RepID=A0A553HKK2_9PEZI|nr:hypothetical protein FHL15_010664 [Xylaria flabelliformis]